MKKSLWHNHSSTSGINYIHNRKSAKVGTERLCDLDRFSVMNDLLTMPVEELKWFQKILGKF